MRNLEHTVHAVNAHSIHSIHNSCTGLRVLIPQPEVASWPHSGGESPGGNKTGVPIGSGYASLISTAAWLSLCSGVLIYVWSCKTHEMTEVGYGLE